MKRTLLVGFLLIGSAFFGFAQATPQRTAQTAATAAPTAVNQRALLDQYCVTCHSDTAKIGGLSLAGHDLSKAGDNAELWERVIRKLRAGVMPPSGSRRPDKATLEGLNTFLETQIDRVAASKPAAVRPGVHRLNRTEYANAVRDMLGLDIDAAALLPVDDSGYGFDNVASSLNMSTALLESYVSAAGKISRLALGLETSPTQRVYTAPQDLSQEEHIEGLPFGTRGGMLIKHYFPVDGDYAITWAAVRGNTGQLFGKLRPEEKLEIAIDGERVRLIRWGDLADGIDLDDQKNEFRVPVKAGLRTVTATFLATTQVPIDDLNKHPLRSVVDSTPLAGFTFSPQLSRLTIMGPYDPKPTTDLVSRRKILTCTPASAADEAACAQKILTQLTRSAFRRPSNTEDMETLLSFYQEGRTKGSFEQGIELALRRILADPEFIYRTEIEPANVRPGQTYKITDLELASRLSFFLWSTPPDEELLNLASQKRLSNPQVLEAQTRRLLADPRSATLAKNFAGQWLQLRNLGSASPLVHVFPNFDDNLRQAFRTETEMFFESIMREDRNIVDLLTADYTFVNDRLARHYGIPNIYGANFRRVALTGDLDVRRGLLGKGAIQLVTGLADRTSPVLRGKWVLMNLLGTIPPDPPANVPALRMNDKSANGQPLALEVSMRKRMEEHRTNPACASCHKMMDPIGFTLENFDAVGSWRTVEYGERVNTADELVDGTKVDGPASLRQALVGYSPQFIRTFTEKLMIYALGRGVQYYDMPVVRSVVRDAARNQNKFSSIVVGIVKSAPFQMNTKVQATASSQD